MIDIKLLEELVAFAECGTLSAAAEKLHTSQPALTRSMKRLEYDLGVDLFIRGKNRLDLNDVGKKTAEFAKIVLVASSDFENKVKAYERSLRTISIGFCSPVAQSTLTPLLNNIFKGMTLSADMMDDGDFLNRLKNGTYQLAVTHFKPDDDLLYFRKCGHEELYISLDPSDPLTFYPELYMKDLNNSTILILQGIGFWEKIHSDLVPNAKKLVQTEFASLFDITSNSRYPAFVSDHFIKRGEIPKGRINIPILDDDCKIDYYLVCLKENRARFDSCFKMINDATIS